MAGTVGALTERPRVLRCVRCGRVVEETMRCGCGSGRLRCLRRDELAAWAALEEEALLTPEERHRAVMVRCGMTD